MWLLFYAMCDVAALDRLLLATSCICSKLPLPPLAACSLHSPLATHCSRRLVKTKT